MGRKEDGEAAKKKQSAKEDVLDLTLQAEISVLLQYLKMMPMSIRAQFLAGLGYLAEHPQLMERQKNHILALVSSCSMPLFEPAKNKFIINIFCRFLKLNKLKALLNDPNKRKANKDKPFEEQDDGSKNITAFEPNISSQEQSFDPIEVTINPQYEFYVKMWKIYTDTHLNVDYRVRELNSSYSFFAPPRFFLKVEEMREFQTNFPQKSNILMLSFEGSKIVGKKSFAFTQGSIVYWCTKKSKSFDDVLNEIMQEKEKQIKEKEAGKKRDGSLNEEAKLSEGNNNNTAEEGLKMNNNFKVSYKMIGHHGRVTSISLSDDQLYLISAGVDRTIKLWCLRQKTLLAQYKGHLGTIWSVNFNKCGYFFLSGSADKMIKLWVTDDPTPQRVYIGHTEDVIKAEFMSNPDLLISCSDDRTVRIWNVLTTDPIHIFKTQNVTINMSMSLSGRYLITCDWKGKMNLYDLLEGKMLNQFVVPERDSDVGSVSKDKNLRIHDMCFSFDQKEFSCVSSRYILIYSFEKICEKPSKNLYSDIEKDTKEQTIATKEVIYTGRESNLVYCRYHEKGVLVIGASVKKKQ